jgi:alpha-amylase
MYLAYINALCFYFVINVFVSLNNHRYIYAYNYYCMKRNSLLLTLFVALLFANCKTANASDVNDTASIENHPAWIMQGNIYEVNIRQYTAEGTFNSFATHLQRLKDMGVQTLWFMPINPISVKDRKGVMGSYYAVADYTAVNPEYGSLQDWKNLVKKAHDMGFKVIIDWVPNHTGADHRWLTSNIDFYEKDNTGKPISPFDWTDVRKLNYKNPALVDSMIAAMKYWIKESNIDGYRVDVAGDVPREFYAKAIPELRKLKNVFMLAEAEKPWLNEVGFDATYGWNYFQMSKKVAAGKRNALALDSTLLADSLYPSNKLKLLFTSNHDENSWNKADYQTMPGNVHAPFAVLTQTLPKAVPLIYSGQEEPVLDSISFFYKNPIRFGKYQRAAFYKTLLNLRKNNSALAANAGFTRLSSNMDNNIYAFLRYNNNDKVLVITNLSNSPQTFSIGNASIAGKAINVFDRSSVNISSGANMQLPAWGYAVYEYK